MNEIECQIKPEVAFPDSDQTLN